MARPLVLGALVLGCSASSAAPSDPPLGYEPLVALDDWQGVERDDDPFVTDAEAVAACARPGFRVEPEQSWLEIDTTICSWVTVTGSARFGVERGQELKLEVSHFDLDAPAPTDAELRLRLGSCDAWSTTIPIPSTADLLTDEIASPCALEAGDTVWFHLRNHGQNSYQLRNLAVLR